MTLREFAEEVKNLYNEQNETKIEVTSLTKNNGVEMIGWREENPNSICTNIYAEYYYKKVCSTDIDEEINDIEDVVNELRKLFKLPKPYNVTKITEMISDFSKIKDKIIPVLVSKKRNEKLLKDLVWKEYNDLAIIYKIVVDDNLNGIGMINVTAQLVEKIWIDQRIDLIDIHEWAMHNLTRICQPYIKPMNEILTEMISETALEGIDLPDNNDFMYVITTKLKSYGANAILDRDFMSKIVDEYKGFRLIPSSVHEWILVKGDMTDDYLNNMINDVNRTQVEESEVLSDHVYEYYKDMELSYNVEPGDY